MPEEKETLDSFRSKVIVALVVIALGCAAGIGLGIKVGNDQHSHDIANTNITCWGSFDARTVIRAVAAGGLQAPLNKQEQQLIASSPLFKALIVAAKNNQKNVEKFIFKLIPLPTNCKGHNPNPVDKIVLKAAGVPKNIRQ